MNSPIKILAVANQLAAHTYQRQGILARNIANADTPGYRTRDLEKFELNSSQTIQTKRTHHKHISSARFHAQGETIAEGAFGTEAPNGNNVSIEEQMVRGAEVKMQHDLALGVYQKSMAILRASLGRR